MARWIKVYDGLLEWGWHTRPEMVSLFVHLLLKANIKDGHFEGVEVKRGQLITSLNSLVKLTGITKQTIRTCLKNLEETGEISQKSTQRYTLITICKYDTYQAKKETTQHSPNTVLTQSQHSPNTVLTPSIEYKNIDNKDIKKEDYSCWARLSPAEQKQEQQEFFEIFFFKNFQNPFEEVGRFVASNSSNLWKNKAGKSYDTREQRRALAELWKQKPAQDPRIKINGFLTAWKKCYERCKEESPKTAPLFLHKKVTCCTSNTYGHTDELQVYCPRPVFDWLFMDEEHKQMILQPLETLKTAYQKTKICFYPVK